ncbi:MAG: hypothetical protein IJV44_08770 [Prevotella sp.]|nr:hypothetical protein [Prevotella sp.]MBR1547010.1 hypothetical protein [Prevotella sp.]
MSLYKFTKYLSYAGGLLFLLYLIVSIVVYHTKEGFKESDGLGYLMYISVGMMLPDMCYELWHFKTFKAENKNRLISWGLLAAMVILSLIFT